MLFSILKYCFTNIVVIILQTYLSKTQKKQKKKKIILKNSLYLFFVMFLFLFIIGITTIYLLTKINNILSKMNLNKIYSLDKIFPQINIKDLNIHHDINIIDIIDIDNINEIQDKSVKNKNINILKKKNDLFKIQSFNLITYIKYLIGLIGIKLIAFKNLFVKKEKNIISQIKLPYRINYAIIKCGDVSKNIVLCFENISRGLYINIINYIIRKKNFFIELLIHFKNYIYFNNMNLLYKLYAKLYRLKLKIYFTTKCNYCTVKEQLSQFLLHIKKNN